MLKDIIHLIKGRSPSATKRQNIRKALEVAESLSNALTVDAAATIGEAHFGSLLNVTGTRTLTFPVATLHPGRRVGILAATGAVVTLAGGDVKMAGANITTLRPLNGLVIIESAGGVWRVTGIGAQSVDAIGNLRIGNLAADPATPSAGTIYYNTVTNKLKFYNGSTWEVVTSAVP
jgi:hypothetical protein